MLLVDGYEDFAHYKCAVCGYEHFFREGAGVNAQLYEADSDYNADLIVALDHVDLIQWNHKKTIRYLRENFPSGTASILDIGCFNGFFVRELLNCGFDATGIDFNNKALDFGKRNYKLDGRISNKTIQDLQSEGLQFDVVTLFEVIEHLDDFSSVLSEASKLLKPGGSLILSTPNSKMCWRPDLDFPPHHLSRFTPKALESCVIRLGFKSALLLEQTSSFDLFRNYVGTFFRHKEKKSMRGGEFKNKQLTNVLRRGANKAKWVGYILLWPLDVLLHAIGIRYISQMVVARK